MLEKDNCLFGDSASSENLQPVIYFAHIHGVTDSDRVITRLYKRQFNNYLPSGESTWRPK